MAAFFTRGFQPDSQSPDDQQVSFWCRLLARSVGTCGGIICMALGIFVCVSFHASCVAAGILQVFFGFILVLFEAPCCCTFLDFVDKVTKFVDGRPYWQKAFFYCILAIPPVAMCIEVSTFFGAGMLFLTGVLYGMFALGKKADRETMLARAGASQTTKDDWDTQLVDSNRDPV